MIEVKKSGGYYINHGNEMEWTRGVSTIDNGSRTRIVVRGEYPCFVEQYTDRGAGATVTDISSLTPPGLRGDHDLCVSFWHGFAVRYTSYVDKPLTREDFEEAMSTWHG